MLNSLKRFFGEITQNDSGSDQNDTAHDLRVATCALFLEMARIDETFTPEETETIIQVLKEKYDLSAEHADALMAEADGELKKSIDLWQFARLINENYSNDEKIEIIEILWQIVFVDGKMTRYENYMMHKLESLLRLTHKQLMDAKLKVIHSS
jgi:uncharacterized tellurite resistance protein B-like protein